MVTPADIGHTETYVSDRPDPTQQVSHETIYTAIYAQPRGELRRQLIACLRHGHSTLKKNTAQLTTLFALSNLWMARRRLLKV